MDREIDFTKCPQRNKTYAGANGNKISIIYNNSRYMLKFPATPTKTQELSYTNSCISEYIGCHIFESVGIPVQKTILGKYTTALGKEKIVVACGDFATKGFVLQDFASLKNQIVDSERNGYGTELSDIEQTFQEQHMFDPEILKTRFWDMFIVDAMIGNWDRHNGNWGFLYNDETDEITLSPVYDCGSCLYPQMDAELMQNVMTDPKGMDFRIYEIPTSAIKINNKKIKYFDFITSLVNADCNAAIKRIVPRIDMEKIKEIIEDTPYITRLQKDFYKEILQQRKEKILDVAFLKIKEVDCSKEFFDSEERE